MAKQGSSVCYKGPLPVHCGCCRHGADSTLGPLEHRGEDETNFLTDKLAALVAETVLMDVVFLRNGDGRGSKNPVGSVAATGTTKVSEVSALSANAAKIEALRARLRAAKQKCIEFADSTCAVDSSSTSCPKAFLGAEFSVHPEVLSTSAPLDPRTSLEQNLETQPLREEDLLAPHRAFVEDVKVWKRGDVYIGRGSRQLGLPKSDWGNPFLVREHGRERAVELYRQHVMSDPTFQGSRQKS